MDFRQYQTKALTFAQPECLNNNYLTLGLIGEIGEVAEKIKKVIRDEKGVFTKEKKESIKKELGDVFWYFSMLCYVNKVEHELANREEKIDFSKFDLGSMVLILTTVACDFLTIKLQGNTFNYVINDICGKLGFTIQDVMHTNIRKLNDRKLRGKIGGNGDDR